MLINFLLSRPDVVSFTPTNMTADEFMFDFAHPTRAPVEGMPWFIDDDDGGRVITRDEAKQQAILLAGAFKEVLDLKVDEVVYFCSPNAIECKCYRISASRQMGADFIFIARCICSLGYFLSWGNISEWQSSIQ